MSPSERMIDQGVIFEVGHDDLELNITGLVNVELIRPAH